MPRSDADWLAGLARHWSTASDLDAIWNSVVEASLSRIDGAGHAGITVLSRRSLSTPAASDNLVHDVDQQQYAAAEGPCLVAILGQEPVVHVADLSADPRWPRFAPAAVELGVRSVLSLQLSTSGDAIGALNIYAATAHAFTEEAVHTGTLLAAHAAVAAAAAINSANLRLALAARDVIGQAKGILMERYKITAKEAFDLLTIASQTTNRKLKDIAADLTATGDFAAMRPRTNRQSHLQP